MIGVPFTLSISPSPQSVAPAGTASFNITATNNVSGQPAQQINLNWMDPNANLAQFGCSGYPSLPQFTFNLPSTVTTGQASVTATITPPINTASFNCIFEISGSFGLFNTLASGQMDITTAPSYTFSQPATQTVTGSGQANFPLSVSSVNSFAGTVNFTASVSSQGVACGINVSSISSAYVSAGGVGQTTMTVNVPAGCAVGNYTVAISSSSSGSASSPTETATLAVQTAPDFTLTISGPQTMLQGSSTQPYTISVAPASGSSFSGSVSLSLGNGGAITGGVTLGSLSASASQNSAGTLMLNVANNATLGTYPILVTASSSGITHSVLARLTVNLGSNPGTTIQLGSIAVPIGSATTPSTIPPTIIVPPLVSGDSLNSSGCTTTVAGTSAVVGMLPGSTTTQTLTLSAPSSVQAGTTDTLSCTTRMGHRVAADVVEYVDREDVELDYNAQGGGNFLLTATTSGFSEVDDIIFTGQTSIGPLPTDDDDSGDQSATDTVYLSAGSCAVVWVTASGFDLDGDGDNGGPAFADATTEFCYEQQPTVTLAININNTATNSDDITILSPAQTIPAQVILQGATGTVNLSVSPANRISLSAKTLNFTANSGTTIGLTITPLAQSQAANDVVITASYSGTVQATATMTVVNVSFATVCAGSQTYENRILDCDTPDGVSDRIPPTTNTPIQVTVAPNLASSNSGQAITVATLGTSTNNGNFTIGGNSTISLTSTTTVNLSGAAQTAPTGAIGGAPGGGNALRLALVAQTHGATGLQSGEFSVAAIPFNYTDTYYATVTTTNPVVIGGINYIGLRVLDGWSSDSTSLADLDQVGIEEQVASAAAPSGVFALYGFSIAQSPYSTSSTQATGDQHLVPSWYLTGSGTGTPAGFTPAAGVITFNQVHIFTDLRTGAIDIPIMNSGFTISQALSLDANSVLHLTSSKTGAAVTVSGTNSSGNPVEFTSGAGSVLPPGLNGITVVQP